MSSLKDAEDFLHLFEGSDLAYGCSVLTGETDPSKGGKVVAKHWTEHRKVTVRQWIDHLEGRKGLGLSPINSQSKARWGAIDLDVYQGVDTCKLAAEIYASGLPVVACRSKSGGLHIYLFLTEFIPATQLIGKLQSIAAFLGMGNCEIFPKQAAIASKDRTAPDVGNWINMPYFEGNSSLRVGLKEDGDSLSVEDFITFSKHRTLTPEQFNALEIPNPPDALPDGPPCLNLIFARKDEEMRNVTLANAAVYMKKAFPNEWKQKVEELNNKFSSPLPYSEVGALIKSYDSKDYKYQCSVEPLCRYCDATVCKTRKYGVGDQVLLPNNRSLTMLKTVPPIWFMDICNMNGEAKRIQLSTEEIQSFRAFQRKCMEALQVVLPMKKDADWHQLLNSMMKSVTLVDVPEEATPKGQFLEYLQDFLAKASEEGYEVLLRGIPLKNVAGVHFRMRDLLEFLAAKRFVLLKPHEIHAIVIEELKAVRNVSKVKGKTVNYVTLAMELEIQEPFTITEEREAF